MATEKDVLCNNEQNGRNTNFQIGQLDVRSANAFVNNAIICRKAEQCLNVTNCEKVEPIDLTFENRNVKIENLTPSATDNPEVEVLPTNASILSNVGVSMVPIASTSVRIAEIMRADRIMSQYPYFPKKRGRKRKFHDEGTHMDLSNVDPEQIIITEHFDTNDSYSRENKQTEVLKAAKSLFSKRTRTLYHWMYPNAPKQQLKIAVANSWETLGTEEKEFYISQVLGRFGFPQCSLMVNPQLGSIRNTPPPPAVIPPAVQTPADETRDAVSSILDDEQNNSLLWPSLQSINHFMNNTQSVRHKRKLGRPPGSKNKKQRKETVTKMLQEEANADDFHDDPELRKEFQQFKWALHMTDK